MSANRNKEHDKAETRKLILNPLLREKPQPRVRNWLGHGSRGNLAIVDHLLLDGATRNELEQQSGWEWTGIRNHLYESLPRDHDLMVVQIDGKYMFDRVHLGIDDLPLPEEVGEAEGLPEGAVRSITVNGYERNPEARRLCIQAHGTSCAICKFSFGEAYGDVAEGYIHVHHLRALSEIGGAYLVDPAADLRPVCPNCHAVLHRRKPAFSIEDIKGFLGGGVIKAVRP